MNIRNDVVDPKGDSIRRVARAATIAVLVASVANLAIYFIVPMLFNLSLEIPLMGPGSPLRSLPVYMVLLVTVAAAGGAAVLLLALNRYTNHPATIFVATACVVLLLSFAGPLSLPVPLGVRLTLASMHVATAVVLTRAMTAQANQQ